jgi:predicted nucleic acid-binding protein
VNGIVDTAVIVDVLRGHSPALTWLAGQDRLGTTPIVWLEVIEGARDRRDQARAVEILRHFERIDPLPEDFDWAIQQALKFKLSHNADMMDCLIASAAQRLNLPLYTANLKHFLPLLGSLARKPYN